MLDPYTPHIEVPEGISSKDSPAEDLPYYFGIIQAMEAAEVASCLFPTPFNTPCIMCCCTLLLPAARAEATCPLASWFSLGYITRYAISCNMQRTLEQCYMVAV